MQRHAPSLVRALTGALLVCAALAAPAGAASIAYVDQNDNVRLTTPDGSRTLPITNDAVDGRRYRTPSQTDDGAIVVPASNNFVYVFNADGTHRTGPWLAPRKDGNSTSPVSAHVTPDGGLIVFHQIHSDGPPNFNIRPRVRVMNGEIPTSDPNCTLFACVDNFIEPRWIPGTPGYGAISLGGEQINALNAQGSFAPWLTSGGADFESLDVSRDGTKAIFQLTADGSPPQGQFEAGELILWEVANGTPQRQLCRVSNFGNQNSHPRFSPDGTQIVWETQIGVYVSATPRDALHNVGTDTCNGLDPTLIAPGGKDPDWGAADVPGGGNPGGGTDPGTGGPDPGAGGTDPGAGGTDTGTGSGGTGSGGAGTGSGGTGTTPNDTTAPQAELRISASQRLARVRSRGLAATVGCSEACTATIELLVDKRTAGRLRIARNQRADLPQVISAAGRTVVIGRGTGRLDAPGTRGITARLTRRARARLGRVRSLALTVRLTVTDRAGNRRIVTRRLTVRR